MIGLDLDGTVLNYSNHVSDLRINPALVALLPANSQPVAIISNQGGAVFSRSDPAKYPSPARITERLGHAVEFLAAAGYPVAAIHISVYHPKAQHSDIINTAIMLRKILSSRLPRMQAHVYIGTSSRKPGTFMLRAAGATAYYGDSPEDRQAADAAGIPFVYVERFE